MEEKIEEKKQLKMSTENGMQRKPLSANETGNMYYIRLLRWYGMAWHVLQAILYDYVSTSTVNMRIRVSTCTHIIVAVVLCVRYGYAKGQGHNTRRCLSKRILLRSYKISRNITIFYPLPLFLFLLPQIFYYCPFFLFLIALVLFFMRKQIALQYNTCNIHSFLLAWHSFTFPFCFYFLVLLFPFFLSYHATKQKQCNELQSSKKK